MLAASLLAISYPSLSVAQPPASPPSPGPGAAVAAAPAGPLGWYDKFHGHIGGIVGFHGWGGMTLSGSGFSGGPDVAGQPLGGFLLAGYVPLSPGVHLGGYFMYGTGKLKLSGSAKLGGSSYDLTGKMDADHVSAGLSLKTGRRVHERVWLGLVGDLGFYSLSREGGDNWYGVLIAPRLHVDVLGLDTGKTKLGPFASFGPAVVPYVGGNAADGVDGRAWLVYIMLCLGLTFGS
jgi:hypothetical protein